MDNPSNFDDFLASSVEREEIIRAAEAYAVILDARLSDMMAAHSVPRLTDDDPMVEQALQSELLERVYDLYRDELGLDLITDEALHQEVTQEAKNFVQVCVMREQALIANATIIIASYDYRVIHHPETVDFDEDTEIKARFIADAISGGFEPNGPWVTFFNEALPGEVFIVGTPYADAHLIQATERKIRQEAEAGERRIIRDQLRLILGDSIDASIESEVAFTTRIVMLCMSPTSSAQREADITSMCMAAGIDAVKIRETIDYLRQAIPVDPLFER